MIQFPATHLPDAWKGLVINALHALGPQGREVRFGQVTAWIESQPGFPGWDAWGSMTKRGQQYPKGQRAVTLAAGKLKADGALSSPRRGYYALALADTRHEAPESIHEAPVTYEAPEAPAEPVKAPEARPVRLNVVTADGVSFTPRNGAVNSAAYNAADAGLRRMAAEQTRCFGAWSSRSAQCGDCPLAGLCQQAGMTDFAEVAAALDAATSAEITDAKAQAEAATVAAAAAAPVAPVAVAPVAGSLAAPAVTGGVTVPFTCPCHECGEDIEAGTLAAYRAPEDGGGVFHMACNPA